MGNSVRLGLRSVRWCLGATRELTTKLGRKRVGLLMAGLVGLPVLAMNPVSSGAFGLPIPITFPASSYGSWSVVGSAPVTAIHATLLRNGNVLLVAGSGNDPNQFAAGTFKTAVWNPSTGVFTNVTTPNDFFCAGHMLLSDGKVLVAGGTAGYPGTLHNWFGSKTTYVFDPDTNSYQQAGDMASGHWYPSVTELGDGRSVALGGLDENGNNTQTSEVYDPATGAWTKLDAQNPWWGLYPNMVLMQDGRLFFSGESTYGNANLAPTIYDWNANTLTPVNGLSHPGRNQGATILLPPAQAQRVMVLGGGSSTGVTSDTNIVDLNQPNPVYRSGPSMMMAKMYVNAVILPDSTVFETGGGSANQNSKAIAESSIFDPATGRFSAMNMPTVRRLYHSGAFLLPDGRVATVGSQPTDGGSEMRIEVFSPPYLFKSWRPTLTSTPTEITYGGTYDFGTNQANPIAAVSLIHPGSVTHQTDTNQRLVALPFTGTAGGVSVTVPTNPNLAPPGWYMAVVVDSKGIPSIASWVHLS